MTTPLSAEICYLLLFPPQFTQPAGQARPLPTPAQKDAPYFFDLDIEFSSVGERQVELEGIPVFMRFQVLNTLYRRLVFDPGLSLDCGAIFSQ